MEIVTLSVTSIDASDRLRPIDDDYAAMIGASMAEYGQRAPIEVLPANADGRYRLISGGHRWRGAQLAGLETVAAIVRDVDHLQADLLEIDENLTRHELNPFDEAVFLARRKEIWVELYPETKQGKAKKKNDKFVVLFESFATATADKLGVSVRTIERRTRRHDHIFADVRDMIAGTWIARRGAYLDAIVALDAAEQRAVVQLLLRPTADGTEVAISEAIRQVRQAPDVRPDPAEEDYKKLLRMWARADVAAKQRFRVFLSNEIAEGRGRRK